NLHFYGVSATASSTSSSSGSKRTGSSIYPVIKAEILSAGEDKEYLAIPEEFSRAWRNMEDAISRSGMYIDSKDKEKGIYTVLYFVDTSEEEKSLLSKLKFWEGEDEGTEYHLSLTGVGDKTEVVVLDDEDKWSASRDASRILSMLQTHYNRLLK
ncbi:MAG: outer membrane protein assembly factor BamC, partial [Gammaproteobacteria bacterium]|nr:outer membrane protein assembly factor BamC [Gammaproteobacteria bacterium]